MASTSTEGGPRLFAERRGPEAPYWVLGLVLGAASGYVQLRVKDPTLSALMVAAFAMFLAYMRPYKPWRWALLLSLCLPAAQLLALLTREKPMRGAVYGSLVGILPAFAGALGGGFMRHFIDNLFREK